MQDELERVRGQAATTLGRLLFEAPPVHADQNVPAPEIISPFPRECMLHLDNTEGLGLTPLCRHCEFNSWMTFSRNEAMTTGTPASKQTYVDSLREGTFNLERQLTADRSRADAAAGNLHLQEMATGSQAFTSDWSPGPAISEGSSHGDPPEVVVIMIDSPPGNSPRRIDRTRSLKGSSPRPSQKANQQKDPHRAHSPGPHSWRLLRQVYLLGWKLLRQERHHYE